MQSFDCKLLLDCLKLRRVVGARVTGAFVVYRTKRVNKNFTVSSDLPEHGF
jgi:hypothetical protein